MRSVKFILAAGAASLMSTAVLAADMAIAPPPQMYAPPPVEDFGGWYLRGDIGMTNSNLKTLHNDLYGTLPATAQITRHGQGFSSGLSYGVGVGYQFNNWFRADITGEYRGKVNFSGSDFIYYGPGNAQSNTFTGGYKSWVGMVNAYVDLGTWWCVTPFIGAGVGFANVTTTGILDQSVANTNIGTYFADGASKTNLAWAAHAGLAYKVNNAFTVELAYRYLDMGTAVHGFGRSFDGSNAGQSSFQYRDITSHDVKLGVRWNLEAAPAYAPPPPPLIRKG